MDGLVHHVKKMCEHVRGSLLEARKGRAAMGAKALRRIHPWSEPKILRETGGQPIPRYKVGAKGIVAQQLERDAAADRRRFLADHREGRLARKAGDLDARFPYGTNAAVQLDGAPGEPESYPDVRGGPGRARAADGPGRRRLQPTPLTQSADGAPEGSDPVGRCTGVAASRSRRPRQPREVSDD